MGLRYQHAETVFQITHHKSTDSRNEPRILIRVGNLLHSVPYLFFSLVLCLLFSIVRDTAAIRRVFLHSLRINHVACVWLQPLFQWGHRNSRAITHRFHNIRLFYSPLIAGGRKRPCVQWDKERKKRFGKWAEGETTQASFSLYGDSF